MWKLLGGIYLGWGLGANDSANVFGTAVATKILKWSTAATLIAIFAFLGAALQGAPTVEFVKSSLGSIGNLTEGLIASFSAALTIMILTIMSIPSSTSQSTAGGIIGMTLALGREEPNWGGIIKAVICWVATPLGAAVFAVILYYLLRLIVNRVATPTVIQRIIVWGTLISGIIAAYSLGANNCGNATGFFYFPEAESFFLHNSTFLAALGGVAIAFGALTYSRKVMMTVGEGITPLDPFTSLVVVLSEGITVYIFALVGVPVSTSQAVVGAVLGIGLTKGIKTVSFKKLVYIFIGWVATPFSAGLIAFGLTKIFL